MEFCIAKALLIICTIQNSSYEPLLSVPMSSMEICEETRTNEDVINSYKDYTILCVERENNN